MKTTDKVRDNWKKYYIEHREAYLKYAKEYRAKKKSEIKTYQASYYVRNRAKLIEYKKKYWTNKKLDKNGTV